MKAKRMLVKSLCMSALTLMLTSGIAAAHACADGGCGGYVSADATSCSLYSWGTNSDTSPSICDSSCSDPCDLSCANDNFKYQGCGDNCVEP